MFVVIFYSSNRKPKKKKKKGWAPKNWHFQIGHASGGQSTGASASALIFPMSIQVWFPLELTSLISFLSKGLSRAFFNFFIFYFIILFYFLNLQYCIGFAIYQNDFL